MQVGAQLSLAHLWTPVGNPKTDAGESGLEVTSEASNLYLMHADPLVNVIPRSHVLLYLHTTLHAQVMTRDRMHAGFL